MSEEVVHCPKCHRQVTTIIRTGEGMIIGKMKLGKNSQIKGGITMACPAGHKVKVVKPMVENKSVSD